MMLFGTSLCASISEVETLRAALKWPNDPLLLVASEDTDVGKAAGILVNGLWRGCCLEFANIFCGENVNVHPPLDSSLQYPNLANRSP